MSTIHEYIQALRAANIFITFHDGDIKIKASRELLTPAVVEEIRSCKAEIIEYYRNSTHQSITPVTPQQSYPLSYAQRRLWVLDQVSETAGLYNVAFTISFQQVKPDLLQRAFSALLERHEILRTTFSMINGEARQQINLPNAFRAEVQHHQIKIDTSIEELINGELFKPFDLSRHAVRASLFERPTGPTLFLVTLHHIVTDGWSINILKRDLEDLYEALLEGRSHRLPNLHIQYKDYAYWQTERIRLGYFDDSRRFWKDKLSGELPVLNLPLDFKRKDFKTYDGASVAFDLPPLIGHKLAQVGQQQQASFYMVLVAWVKVLLYRYTDLQGDLVIGSIISGRDHADLEHQVGFYVNTIVLRSAIEDLDTFSTFLAKVRNLVLETYQHQQFPFDLLVEELDIHRDMSRNPAFDVMVIYEESANESQPIEHDAETNGIVTVDIGVNKFDLTFSFVRYTDGGVKVDINYNRGLFKKEKMMQMAAHTRNLAHAIVQSPNEVLHLLPMMSESERHRILGVFNNTGEPYPLHHSIKELFERQADVSPNNVCILSDTGVSLTFQEMNEKANQLAHYLSSIVELRPGSFVGVMMDSCVERMLALISLIKLGVAYVPIDPDYPAERKQYILKDTAVSTVLIRGNEDLPSEMRDWTVRTIAVTEALLFMTACPLVNPVIPTSPEDVFTILYTSGSTGIPKGVIVPQKGLINRMTWLWKKFSFGPNDVIYQKTPFVFDVSIGELFMPLCFGARLLVASSDSAQNITNNVNAFGVTYIHFSPTMLNKFLNAIDEGQSAMPSIRYFFASGEALLKDTVARFYQNFQVPLVNLYGPTEASIEASGYITKPGDETIPIGKPIANVRLYILDQKSGLLPIGLPGEIGIGGIGVAPGYLNQPAKTKERFITDVYAETGGQIYRTGDVGMWDNDGNILFLGRKDNQTSINGSRIEPGEIESAILEHALIGETAVIVQKDNFDNYHLVGYYVRREPGVEIASIQEQDNVIMVSQHEPAKNEFIAAHYRPLRLEQLVDEAMIKYSNRTAVSFKHKTISYSELSRMANTFAAILQTDYGVGPGDRVGVMMQRSEKVIVTLLAVLKTGAAYVPIDPDYPEKRISLILHDADVKVIVVDTANAVELLPNSQIPVVYSMLEQQINTKHLVPALRGEVGLQDLCYVCYTSGSTGVPKGVMIEHAAVVDYVHTFRNYFNLSERDVILHQASLAFDVAVEEIFPALSSGAKVVVLEHGGRDVSELIHTLNHDDISLLSTTPLVIGELNARAKELGALPRVIISGGDELRPAQIDKLVNRTALYNTYGPTEATVCATFGRINHTLEYKSIGTPIANHRIYILDDADQQVAVGVIGEIYIAGAGLARGYVNKQEETQRAFIPNPFHGGLMYRTGDMGCWNETGTLEFHGRHDRQIKVRGYRIEPSEVDEALLTYNPPIQSFTTSRTSDDSSKHLVTYFRSFEGADIAKIRAFLNETVPFYMVPAFMVEISEFPFTIHGKMDLAALPLPHALSSDYLFSQELRTFLKHKLPSYMVPTHLRRLEKMPTTVTGKIDRKALEKLSAEYGENDNCIAPATETEKKLALIWERVLGRAGFGLNHNFFEVGGNSLKAIQIVSAIYKEFHKEVSLKDIFNNATVGELARVVESDSATNPALIIRLGRIDPNRPDLFFIPPILGSATIFKSLATEIGPRVNMYGFQYKGFDRDEPFHDSIEEMAGYFINEIKRVTSRRSLALVGYSMGVPVAFETAKMLEAQGYSVAMTIMDRGVQNDFIGSAPIVSEKELSELLDRELGDWFRHVDPKDKSRITRLVLHNTLLLERYEVTGKIKGDLAAIEALGNSAPTNMQSWRSYTNGKFTLRFSDGEHYELLDPQYIAQTAHWIACASGLESATARNESHLTEFIGSTKD